MTFQLNTTLENDSVFICDWKLSQVRLSKNASFPWILLIPRQNDIVEIIDLSDADQEQLLIEIRAASHAMKEIFNPKKLNVANIGNIVSQLHVHVVARYEEDGAWPGPIWGRGISSEYDTETLANTVEKLQKKLTALAA